MFSAKATAVSFDIPVREDIVREEVEAFSLTITDRSHVRPDKVNIGHPSVATVNIVDTTGELTCNDYYMFLVEPGL